MNNNDEQIKKEKLYEFFWEYFSEVQNKLLNLEELPKNEVEKIFRNIQMRLMVIDRNLGFEISGKKDYRRDFIITANGLVDLFPTVRELIEKAPHFMVWSIFAFKQKIPYDFSIKIGSIDVNSHDIFFNITENVENKNLLDLEIYLKNNEKIPENRRREVIYQLLDGILGEEDVETFIGVIKETNDEKVAKSNRLVLEDRVRKLRYYQKK